VLTGDALNADFMFPPRSYERCPICGAKIQKVDYGEPVCSGLSERKRVEKALETRFLLGCDPRIFVFIEGFLKRKEG
jgi:hypothetical protein